MLAKAGARSKVGEEAQLADLLMTYRRKTTHELPLASESNTLQLPSGSALPAGATDEPLPNLNEHVSHSLGKIDSGRVLSELKFMLHRSKCNFSQHTYSFIQHLLQFPANQSTNGGNFQWSAATSRSSIFNSCASFGTTSIYQASTKSVRVRRYHIPSKQGGACGS